MNARKLRPKSFHYSSGKSIQRETEITNNLVVSIEEQNRWLGIELKVLYHGVGKWNRGTGDRIRRR